MNKLFVKSYLSSNVPFGWKREIINGSVVYTTPSNYLLWSPQEISLYLQSEGTCKCGIECPLILENVFNFDPKVQTVAYFPHKSSDSESSKRCKHCSKINHTSSSIFLHSSSSPSHQNVQSLSVFKSSTQSFSNGSPLSTYSSTNESNSTNAEPSSIRNSQQFNNNVLNWLPLNHHHSLVNDRSKSIVSSQLQMPTNSPSLHQINGNYNFFLTFV